MGKYYRKGVLVAWVIFMIAVLAPLTLYAADSCSVEERITCGSAGEIPKAGQEEETIYILFVGNSLTGRNDMPAMFQNLVSAGGYKVYVEWIWKGGCTLAKYANRQTAEGAVFYKKLRSRNWDYVVLQDQSRKPLLYPTSVKKSVSTLSRTIRRNGAEPVLFMTWAHKTGASFYQTAFARRKKLDQKKFQKKVSDLYNEMGEKNDVLVAKAGVAFWRCGQYWSSIKLYRSDKLHPTKEGSYLAACTVYATIFQEEVPKENLGISKSTASTLRRVAEKVTFTSAGNL